MLLSFRVRILARYACRIGKTRKSNVIDIVSGIGVAMMTDNEPVEITIVTRSQSFIVFIGDGGEGEGETAK